ncbi:MAG TPA: fluoride efflux transporter CrcB [Opitutaceae bacterium]|jgi:CrcB protein
MLLYLWIAAGSALGGVGRFALSVFVADHYGDTFPWGTLLINIAGSFAIGLFYTLTGSDGRWPVAHIGRQFFMVGVCGGFTTFSSFSLQTLLLARTGQWHKAGAYVAASVILCLLGVWLGHLAAMLLNRAGTLPR